MKASTAIWRGTAIGLALMPVSIMGVAAIAADSPSGQAAAGAICPSALTKAARKYPPLSSCSPYPRSRLFRK